MTTRSLLFLNGLICLAIFNSLCWRLQDPRPAEDSRPLPIVGELFLGGRPAEKSPAFLQRFLLQILNREWLPTQLDEMVRVVVNQPAARLPDEVVVLELELLEQVVQVVFVLLFHLHLRHVVNDVFQVRFVFIFHPPTIVSISPYWFIIATFQMRTLFCC